MRLLLILALALALISCNNSEKDREYTQKIIGIWSASYNYEDYKSYGELNYKSDGSFSDKGYICIKGKCNDKWTNGNYEIKNGVLHLTITSSDSEDYPPGFVMRSKIISMDTQKIVFLSLDTGSEFVRYRVEKAQYF